MLGRKLTAAVALALALTGCAGPRSSTGAPSSQPASGPADAPAGPGLSAGEAWKKLRAISKNKVQLWVVVHVRAHKHVRPDGTIDEEKLIAGALADADAVVLGGGDAIVLINSRAELPLYERVIAAVRGRYPDFPLGISALAYGPANLTEGFRLAQKFGAQIVWCETVPGEHIEYEDDDGKWVEAEVIDRQLALDTQAKLKPDAMHVAGVHMKYTRPKDGLSFEDAMRRAVGSVDGVNITGPKTGQLADVERIKLARSLSGGFPLGVASGVSTENVAQIIGYIDYALVGTSLKMDGNDLRTDEEKVRELRTSMSQLGGGPKD